MWRFLHGVENGCAQKFLHRVVKESTYAELQLLI